MTYLFWISISTLFCTYIGYPVYVVLRAKLFRRNVKKDLNYKPMASIIMSAYNEEAFIARKIDNLLNSDYPKDKIEILVGSDGSTDRTNEILLGISDDRVRIFPYEKRRGKVGILNDIVPKAHGEILIFCDVRQAFEKDAIINLAANFADGGVGCVSGELIFDSGYNNGIVEGVGFYWNYEKLLRRGESAIHSMVGATGAIYAIKRKLYTAPPADTILDDVYIPLSVVRQGYRSIWDSEARVHDKPAFTPAEEYRRKARTLAGNYQIFGHFMDLFVPFRSSVAMPLISHKLLRLLAPFFLILALVSNFLIAEKGTYGVFLIGQIFFYMLAIIGAGTHDSQNKRLIIRISSIVYIFCLMNFTALVGLYRFVLGKQNIAWERG